MQYIMDEMMTKKVSTHILNNITLHKILVSTWPNARITKQIAKCNQTTAFALHHDHFLYSISWFNSALVTWTRKPFFRILNCIMHRINHGWNVKVITAINRRIFLCKLNVKVTQKVKNTHCILCVRVSYPLLSMYVLSVSTFLFKEMLCTLPHT